MVDLERNVIPKVSTQMTTWKRYVDDTLAYISPSYVYYVLSSVITKHS